MATYYLLWASGPDHSGFVCDVTKILFAFRCNLEDSSMMRLGSEFAMFVIFTAPKELNAKQLSTLKKHSRMNIGVKRIPAREARFMPSPRQITMIRVHGKDKPGLVYRVTECLARHGFNITDLSTHRTQTGRKPGYILLIEGELLKNTQVEKLRTALARLSRKLDTRIGLDTTLTSTF